MIEKMERFPTNNPNPVLTAAKNGTLLYSNEAADTLLREWGVGVGQKLPLHIEDFVQKVISRNSPEKMEVKTEKKVYLIVFHPLLEEECVNIYGFDISEQKELEEKLHIKERQSDVLHKIGKIAFEYESLQTFMDESVKLITSILELEYCKIMELLPDGRFLLRAGIGWKSEFVGKNIVEGEKGSQAGYTLLLGMPVIVEDFEEENRFEKPKILKIHGVASGASVIIGSKEQIFGVLVVNSTKKRKFTSDDTYFLNSVAFLIAQVIERKKAEEALKKAHDNLEVKVKERTEELEKAYKLLKESEEELSEAQKIAHIGSWNWNIVTDKLYWSDETYYIFGLNPQEFDVTYSAFLSCVHPEDQAYVDDCIKEAIRGEPYCINHRVIQAGGEERIVHERGEVTFNEDGIPVRMRGTIQDITENKKAEKTLANIEITRKKEIHHRIKNNLQVISSLLDLQAEKFKDKDYIKVSEVLDAFGESQDRVISMALIHEELYKGEGLDELNFSLYIEKLTEDLLQTYGFGNTSISLNMNMEKSIFFDMDTAVPLGIIVNELVSNALKHAFTGRDNGEIKISLCREKPVECINRLEESEKENFKNTSFILTVSDDGIGTPESLDLKNLDSLGLHLVTSLVEQLEGELEIKRENGTEFTIRFTVKEKNY
ncbi:MAG TPA: histidine kinase dimerization/phosphoacceptor domain -containing protein [Methanosarcina sp.]|nr:histidine kinase dimerization/phosphoacceptor domain -containing protein [Methanosarcina sp.]